MQDVNAIASSILASDIGQLVLDNAQLKAQLMVANGLLDEVLEGAEDVDVTSENGVGGPEMQDDGPGVDQFPGEGPAAHDSEGLDAT